MLRSIVAVVCILLFTHAAAAQDLVEQDGSHGFWLRGPSIEAFIAIQPAFRITTLRRPGAGSMMSDSKGAEKGLRLAFMSPNQIATSFTVGTQPAEVVAHSPQSATLLLAVADHLQYTVAVAMDEKLPRLRLTYDLQNLGTEPRKIACWSVISLAGEGTITLPFGIQPKARRRMVLPWWTEWPQPTYRFGRDAMAVDISAPPIKNCKVGLISDAGWMAVRSGDQLLISTVAFDATAEYPEDGANLTVYQSGAKDHVRCEIEQVGPLRPVEPQKTARMVETLDLFEITKPLPADATPDALRTQIDAVRKTRPEPAAP